MTLFVLFSVVSLTAGQLKFTGSAGIHAEKEFFFGVQGDTLRRPWSDIDFTIDPSLSVWGIPLSLQVLLSTQENPLRQQLDKFHLFLHPQEWLKSNADLSGLALAIKGVEVGSSHPSYSPLILSGSTVLGGAVEFNPWFVYVAGTAGRVQRAVPVTDSTAGAYNRLLYSGRFGFGKKEGTHFFLTGMLVTDDTVSLLNNQLPLPGETIPPVDSFEAVRPKENHLLGAEFNLELAKRIFRLESELAVSELTRDKRMPIQRWKNVPDWAENIARPTLSSQIDFAYSIRPSLNFLGTKFYGKVNFVGPGYVSLGAPSLRNDNVSLGCGIERDFFKRSVSARVSYSDDHDNLLSVRDSAGNVLHFKSATTRHKAWNADLSISFPNLPYLTAAYCPYSESADSLSSKAQVVAVCAGHSFMTGSLSHNLSVSVNYSDLESTDPSAGYNNWDGSLNYNLEFASPLSFGLAAGYNRAALPGAPTSSRIYFDLTPSYTVFKAWTNSLSLGATFGEDTRYDGKLNSRFPIWKICDASVDISGVIFDGTAGKYKEVRLATELRKSW